MNINGFIRVSQIIERDSKDASYKFALLRSTIDVIDLFDQHIAKYDDKVIIPIGLIVERWLWYYYPLLDSEIFLPQKNGEPEGLVKGKNISFRKHFNPLIKAYSEYGEFEHFYNDYKNGKLDVKVNRILLELVIDLQNTITKMPMKYIGKSVSKKEYSIYQLESSKKRVRKSDWVNTPFLIQEMGTFSIPKDFYYVLKHMGSFIGGESSLINKWADFIVSANKSYPVDKSYVLNKLSIKPESFRDVAGVKNYYQKQPNLFCVWSGKKITKQNLNIDHVLPFAHYLNNDIWNLLPTYNTVNSNKRDKIPTPDFIESRKDIIVNYWGDLQTQFGKGFEEEVKVSLAPNINFRAQQEWGVETLEALKLKSEFLIDVRGLEPWSI